MRIKSLRPSRPLVLLCILLLCAFIAFFQRDSSQAIPPVTILDEYKIPVTTRDRFRKTLGPHRNWVNRAEQTFFGKRNSVPIAAQVLRLTPPILTNVEPALKLSTPTFTDTNGLKVWFLGEAPLKQISDNKPAKAGVEIVTRPRLQTAEGMGASMFMGQAVPTKTGMTQVGFGIQCAALLHDDSTEMLLRVENSEFLQTAAIQTNLDINVRLNIRNGKGVLLIQQPKTATNAWAVIIHPLR